MEFGRHMMNMFRHAGGPVNAEAKPLAPRIRSINPAILWALVLCFAVLLFTAKTNAQTTGSGSIQGTVTDSTGAVIPNASVSLAEASTQVTLKTKTNSAGLYIFPNISIGTYTLTVSLQGFETFVSTGNVLEVGSSIDIDAKMTVGSVDTKVEVHSEGLALQTEDPTFKQTIDEAAVLEMPLNGRTLSALVSMSGGAQSNNVQDGNGSKFPVQTSGISIAGAPGNTVAWRLDGGDNNDYMGGSNNPLPFPDAIAQFSVETASLGAQNGTQAGGLVNIVTKSGTNKVHGSGFEFIRNNFLDAVDFFSTCTPVPPATTCNPVDTLHQNQYGGTLGGPIIRNKLFAFGAFQRSVAKSSQTTQKVYVPTANNLAGDFTATDSVAKSPCSQAQVNLIDPITGVPLVGNKYGQPGGPALPTWLPQSLNIIKQFPAISPLVDLNNCGLVHYAIPNITTYNEFDTRVDYTVNEKNNLYARYFIDSTQVPSFYSPTNIFLTTQNGNPEIRYQTLTFGENHVFRADLVNTMHFTATRRQLSRGFAPGVPNMNTFGVKLYQDVPNGLWVNCSGNSHCANFGGGSNLSAVIDDNIPIDFSDDVVWIKGKHQIYIGGEFVRNQFNLNNGYESNGNFTVDGKWSGPGGTTGDGNLDFLEGALANPSGFNISKRQKNALRGYIPTLYAQDTYHATPKLTLTAGIRWQPLFFPHDYFHRGTTFDYNAFLANNHSTVYPAAPAGTFYYGDYGVKPAFASGQPLTFNPNFAFSYDPVGNGKTVVRSGVAYAYSQPNFFVQQRVQQNPPFATLVSNLTPQGCLADPWLIPGSNSISQGCGNLVPGTTTPALNATDVDQLAATPFPQQGQYIVLSPKYKMPDTLQWTLSIQRELPRGWMVQAFYTGNRTHHLLASVPLNPAVYIAGNFGPGGTGCQGEGASGPAATLVWSKTGGVPPAGSPCSVNGINTKAVGAPNNTQARYALTLANPAQGNYYGGNGSNAVSLQESNIAIGDYNGLIITVQHRLSSTFSFLLNYTRSKCLNDADPQGDISGTQFSNPNFQKQDYGRCPSDVLNITNSTLVLKSAFPLHGIAGYLANNWEVAPLLRIVTSTPVNVSEGQDESFTGNGGDRPNSVPGVNPYKYTTIKADPLGAVYADRSYLSQSGAWVLNTIPGTQGNVSRNAYKGPIYIQNDAQISRIFPILGKYNLDLRLEAYNFLNHPSFNNPNSGGNNFTGGSFGEITGTSVGGRVFQGGIKVSF